MNGLEQPKMGREGYMPFFRRLKDESTAATTTVTELVSGGTPLDTDLVGGDRTDGNSYNWSMAAIKTYVGTGTLVTNGQLLIGSTGTSPVAATLTAGANITITNSAGGIQIAASGGADLTAYEEAIAVPVAGTISAPPKITVKNDGSLELNTGFNIIGGGGFTQRYDINTYYQTFANSDNTVYLFAAGTGGWHAESTTGQMEMIAGVGDFKIKSNAGDISLTGGKVKVINRPNGTYFSLEAGLDGELNLSTNGVQALSVSATDNSVGMNSFNQTYSTFMRVNDAGYFEFFGGNTISAPRFNLTTINSHSVLWLNTNKQLQSTSLLDRHALVGNGIGVDPTQELVMFQQDQTVACQFNAGSASGTTDFTVNITFRRVGDTVTVLIPRIGGTMVANSVITTELSAVPVCVPATMIPVNNYYGYVTTNSNNIVPAGNPGIFNIYNDGTIRIWYQSNNILFPIALYGGTGQTNADNGVTTLVYSIT